MRHEYRTFLLMVLIACALTACGPRNPPGQMELLRAAERGDLAAVQSMLQNDRLNINWRAGGVSITPLIGAVDGRQAQTVKFLLREGANPNIATSDGRSPLHAAIYVGDSEILRILIDAGADVNPAKSYFDTPLASAVRYNRVAMIRALLAAGADREKATDGRPKPVDLARRLGFKEAEELLRSYPAPDTVL